ncbi:hypothetical protein MSAN_01732100 [Mycena sanguinolenta]|uniref:Uncharacterized protein n=1 Tax=Mycena sanguinolenta TaxID=230812 RepID=A0A8H7CV63_9AGAR|nr:hypothetical protein MSAN_01732100 [Mycena sanguinolenta]
MFSLTKLSLASLALVGAAYAQVSTSGLSVLVPGGPDLWWLANQPNNIKWTCEQTAFPDFTIWINNSNTTLLTAITPLIAIEQNFNCDLLVSAELVTMPIGTGYTIVLTDPTNGTNVYASSAEFEIKALSAGVPRVERDADGCRDCDGVEGNRLQRPRRPNRLGLRLRSWRFPNRRPQRRRLDARRDERRRARGCRGGCCRTALSAPSCPFLYVDAAWCRVVM